MIHRDYLKRLAEEFGRFLSSIVRQKEAQQYALALADIEQAYKQMLKLDGRLVRSLSGNDLLAFLKIGGTFDIDKSLMMAELLKEEADIARLQQGMGDACAALLEKSLFLFVEASAYIDAAELLLYRDTIAALVKKLSDYELPAWQKSRLFGYFEKSGQFGRAEDILCDLVESGYPEMTHHNAAAFYERLLKKSDDELIAGNLPRDEVQIGLKKLKDIFP